jgi:hypothetical protein
MAFLVVLLVSGTAACAIFSPIFFQQTLAFARNAGYNVYVSIQRIQGNSALRLTVYDVTITAQTQINRDMGILSVLYGESATLEGVVRIGLGMDLEAGKFGILSCDIDDRSVRSRENRAPLAGAAFDPNAIRQEAYVAFKKQGAELAIANYWAEAKRRLESQLPPNWAVGVVVPDQPNLRECPAVLPTPAK